MGSILGSQGTVDFTTVKWSKKPKGILTTITQWSLEEIRGFYNKYQRVAGAQGFYININTYKQITRGTQIAGNEQVFTLFGTSKHMVNVLELIVALTVYAYANIKYKIRFIFLLFDFDNNKAISRDEMVILSTAFIRGIGVMLRYPIPRAYELKEIADDVFEAVDENPDDMITHKELENWVMINFDLTKLLRQYEPEYEPPYSEKIFLGMHSTRVQARSNTVMPAVPKTTQAKPTTSMGRNRFALSPDPTSLSPPKPQRRGRLTSHTPTMMYPVKPKKVNKRTKNDFKGVQYITVRGRVYTKPQICGLKQIFDSLDEDKSGCIDVEEFKAGFSHHQDVQPMIDQIFYYFDENHNGLINFPEFLKRYVQHASGPQMTTMLQWVEIQQKAIHDEIKYVPILRKQTMSLKDLNEYRDLFNIYDKNGDGYLDLDELKRAFSNVMPEAELAEMLEKYDSDKNKRLDIEEFLMFMAPEGTPLPDKVDSVLLHEYLTRK